MAKWLVGFPRESDNLRRIWMHPKSESYGLSWLTPEEARDLAAQLLEAAEQVEPLAIPWDRTDNGRR